ncbi:MAG: cyclic nucleotide-binding domain-containing protein [Bacteroidota bacterium]
MINFNQTYHSLKYESDLDSVQIGSKHYKKGHILQTKGSIVSKAYFVKRGLVKSYDVDQNGKQHILMFACCGTSIFDPNSVVSGTRSELFIETIEDSEIETIDLKIYDGENISSNAKNNIIWILNMNLCYLQKRLLKMMTFTTHERYELFLQDYRDIANRVPQWMIASYLGVTPEALSSVKGKYYRRHKL